MLFYSIAEKLKKLPFLAELYTAKGIRQLKRYLITGISSAALEIFLLFVFMRYMLLSVILSNTMALTTVFWFNFLMNKFWSFSSKRNLKKQLFMYSFLFILNLGASNTIMHLLVNILNLPSLISKAFAIGAIASWNFVIYKRLIYR